MSKLKFCVGNLAKKPYYISQARLRIYSMEELCYFLCEYAGLLDESLMDDNLIAWIDTQCGMSELSKQLYQYAHFNRAVHTFAYAILSAVAYRPETEIRAICQRIEVYETLDTWQRKKTQADQFFKNKQYMVALEGYQRILLERGEKEPLSDALRADIYHNMGCALAALFYYKQAAALFHEAYLLKGYTTDLVDECACMKFALTEKEFESWLEEEQIDARVQGELTKLFVSAKQLFEQTTVHEEFLQADNLIEAGKRELYQEQVDDMIRQIMEAYQGYTNF